MNPGPSKPPTLCVKTYEHDQRGVRHILLDRDKRSSRMAVGQTPSDEMARRLLVFIVIT